MNEGLMALNYECSKCNERMGLYERKSAVLDGDFEWVCSTITSLNIYGRTPMILLTMRPSRLFVKIRCHAVASTRKRSAVRNTGRPRFTTPNEDRYFAVIAKRNRRSTASDLSSQLSSATDTIVSRQTVFRRLGHIGLYARRPVRCVPLTATHCHLRLTWSRKHALWTPQQWSCVMFSDESRFSLQSDSRRTLIWRAPGTHYHQEITIERDL
ncbi:transposable element Tcb1 transposase [Trichonephila clavipes]|nr:transposable element Tcb1 transposase [Trichonephila clavipes]